MRMARVKSSIPTLASTVGLVLLALPLGCSAVITPAATTYPLDSGMDFSRLATMKRGESCATTILGLFGPNGEASVAAAAQKAGITQVHYVDNRFRNYFLWYRFCVVAYGD